MIIVSFFCSKLGPFFFTADEIFLAGSKKRKRKNRNWTCKYFKDSFVLVDAFFFWRLSPFIGCIQSSFRVKSKVFFDLV